MRVHRFCERCRRIRRVTVSNGALARYGWRSGILTGICDICEDEARSRRAHPTNRERGPR